MISESGRRFRALLFQLETKSYADTIIHYSFAFIKWGWLLLLTFLPCLSVFSFRWVSRVLLSYSLPRLHIFNIEWLIMFFLCIKSGCVIMLHCYKSHGFFSSFSPTRYHSPDFQHQVRDLIMFFLCFTSSPRSICVGPMLGRFFESAVGASWLHGRTGRENISAPTSTWVAIGDRYMYWPVERTEWGRTTDICSTLKIFDL